MAIIPAPITWSAATSLLWSRLNTEIRDAINFFLACPSVRAYHTVSQSIPNAAATALLFNSERWDTDSMHSTSSQTSRITFNTAGVYVIGGCVAWDMNNPYVGLRSLRIRLNGTTDVLIDDRYSGTSANGIQIHHSVETVWRVAAGDYVELVAYQSAGGGLSVLVSNASSPEFWASRMPTT